MKMASWIGLVIAVVAVGCSPELEPDSGRNDSGRDDRDSDDDGDTSDAGTDTDFVDDDLVNCRSEYDTPLPGSVQNGGECTTDQLYCGDFIQATTVGGSTHYDTDHYLTAGIATGSENWDAPERAYLFRQPVGESVRLTFYGPCGDMAIAACIGWECTDENAVQQGDCSAVITRGDDGGVYRDFPATSAGVREFEIIVDGRDGDVGNFGVRVECFGR